MIQKTKNLRNDMMKVEFILNNEDMAEAKSYIEQLLKKKDLKIGDSITSGGFGVMLDDEGDKQYTFIIYREVGLVFYKKQD